MNNKLFYHVLIDVSIASGLIFLDGLRKKRKEIKRLNKKLDEVSSDIQSITFDVELLGENYKEIKENLKPKGC